MKRFAAAILGVSFLLSACGRLVPPVVLPGQGSGAVSSGGSSQHVDAPELPVSGIDIAKAAQPFAANVDYEESPVVIDPGIAKDFSVDTVTNLKDMEKAYGAFTAAEKKFLAENKFLLKDLPLSNIQPQHTANVSERDREFWVYYNALKGGDAKARGPENAIFYSSDVFLHAYTVLFTELLKEMENIAFYPSMRKLSQTFFASAQEKWKAAPSDAEKEKWRKVRNYFAVPYALLSKVVVPTPSPYGGLPSLSDEQRTQDSTIDTAANVVVFVKSLKLDPESEKDVLSDVNEIFAAKDRGAPSILKEEYDAYGKQSGLQFAIDWTQFTPRSHYTSSSLRRQYFRAMNWYIQVPFFMKSPALTAEAFAVTELFAEHADLLKEYSRIEATIGFLVGTSDDLMPVDYLQALSSAKEKPNPEAAIMDFLVKAKPPRIKSIAAFYPDVGSKDTSDVLLLTKGMRLFSGKFIIDSYWTGMLTQGDEAPKPGYSQKLPPMASSLEVMALLGSDYARSQIPTLDFYKPTTKEAIDQAMRELAAETEKLDSSFWMDNIYSITLWSIKGLFAFEKEFHDQLPRFMQSAFWPVKTLQTASAFWTEMRHATLLYAKQSFAELGGGAPCDPRKIPPPPKSYVEPQLRLFDRLLYLAKRSEAGIRAQNFTSLQNFPVLGNYIELIRMARDFTQKQLRNTAFNEKIIEHRDPDPDQPGGVCVWYEFEGESPWENLRTDLFRKLESSLPYPVEGPVLPVKDKRAALIADIHTGGDSENPHRILYEATGVPKLIFVAVNDVNGPRLTVGLTYSHYEFTEPYGGKRMTDEEWQTRFYQDPGAEEDPYRYTPVDSWTAQPQWYQSILHSR